MLNFFSKYKFVVLYLIVTLLILSYFDTVKENNRFNNSSYIINNATQTRANLSSLIIEDGMPLPKVDDFHQLVSKSDLIVKATVISELSDHYYTLQIDNIYKDSNNKRPESVYLLYSSYNNKLVPDLQYVLFLRESDFAYFPAPMYKVVESDHVFKIEDDYIIHRSSFFKQRTELTTLEQVITNSHEINTKNLPLFTSPVLPNRSLTIDDMIAQADLVAHIKVAHIFVQDLYYQEVQLQFNKLYTKISKSEKERLEKERFILPPGLKSKQEYLLFLKEYEGMYYALSTKGSVISKEDTQNWDEALHKISLFKTNK